MFEIYELAIRVYPDSFLLNYSYAELLSENKSGKAIDFYKIAIALYDDNPENKKYNQEFEKALKKSKDNNQ